MLCEKCQQQQATVHLQQTVNGQTKELHLCQSCAAQVASPLSFNNFFKGVLDSILSEPPLSPTDENRSIYKKQCRSCGLTYEEFKKTSRLGCVDCYDSFRREMNAILKNIQGSNQHQGKFPQKSGEELLARRELENLKVSLSKAVENEEYEEAAGLRDRIRELEGNA